MAYVQITREEFEQWLDSTPFAGKWNLKHGTVGVYQLNLSKTVAIEVSSSIGQTEQAMGLGNASIQLRLASLVTGHTLNKVAQGQSHFKRVTGWQSKLDGALRTFKEVYMKSATFYDTIAEIADRNKYKAEMTAKIEAIPSWKENPILTDFHKRIQEGGVLTPKQQAVMIGAIKDDKKSVVVEDAPLLVGMRNLYQKARTKGDQRTMQVIESMAKQYKSSGRLSDKQKAYVQSLMRQYDIDLDVSKIASEIRIILDLLRR